MSLLVCTEETEHHAIVVLLTSMLTSIGATTDHSCSVNLWVGVHRDHGQVFGLCGNYTAAAVVITYL